VLGENPFQLDSRKMHGELQEFLDHESRFVRTKTQSPKLGAELHAQLNRHLVERMAQFRQLMLAKKNGHNGVEDGRRVLVAYGSETGNAEKVATHLCHLLSGDHTKKPHDQRKPNRDHADPVRFMFEPHRSFEMFRFPDRWAFPRSINVCLVVMFFQLLG